MNKVFYGWILLAGLFIMYMLTNGVILNTLPIFYPELVAEYSWTKSEVTKPAQLLFLLVALTSPFIGAILDRYSARILMLIGSLIILIGFYLFYRLDSLADMSLAYILFSVGITCAGIIPSMHLITKWFNRYRGIAVGVLLIGSSLGGSIFNQIAGINIESQGWRAAILVLAAIAAVMTLLPALFLIRDTPQSMGLEVDGIKPDSSLETKNSMGLGPTLGSVLQTPNFYLLLFVTGAMWFTIVGVIQHQTLYFSDLGIKDNIKNVLSLFFICSIIGKLGFGWLSDHFPKRSIMILATANLTLGAILLYYVELAPNLLLWLYAICFGIGFSGTFTMIQLLVAEYYAGASYGKILGLVTTVDTLAGVLGIMILGKLRTAHGTYSNGFLILVGLGILATICGFLLQKTASKPDTKPELQ